MQSPDLGRMTWPTTRPIGIEPDAQLLARIPIGEADELLGDDRLIWVFWCLRAGRGDLADLPLLH